MRNLSHGTLIGYTILVWDQNRIIPSDYIIRNCAIYKADDSEFTNDDKIILVLYGIDLRGPISLFNPPYGQVESDAS